MIINTCIYSVMLIVMPRYNYMATKYLLYMILIYGVYFKSTISLRFIWYICVQSGHSENYGNKLLAPRPRQNNNIFTYIFYWFLVWNLVTVSQKIILCVIIFLIIVYFFILMSDLIYYLRHRLYSKRIQKHSLKDKWHNWHINIT